MICCQLNCCLSFFNIVLLFAVNKKNNGLLSIEESVSIIFNYEVGFFLAFFSVIFFCFIIPLCAITIILGYYKKYYFSQRKSVINCFKLLSELYLLNFQIVTFTYLLHTIYVGLINQLDSSVTGTQIIDFKNYKFEDRIFYFNYLFLSSIIFILATYIIETILSYTKYSHEYSCLNFLKKNLIFNILFLSIISTLFSIYFLFEVNYFIYFNIKILKVFIFKFFFSILISTILFLIYFAHNQN